MFLNITPVVTAVMGSYDQLDVLCIDDNADILAIIEVSLSLDSGVQVRAASDWTQALRLLANDCYRPDCILLDERMPDGSGKLLLGEIRAMERHAATPVIFLTASVRARDVEQMHALGAVGVIPKPFDPTCLAQQVRRMLDGSGCF